MSQTSLNLITEIQQSFSYDLAAGLITRLKQTRRGANGKVGNPSVCRIEQFWARKTLYQHYRSMAEVVVQTRR
jgi:hypothetical protein